MSLGLEPKSKHQTPLLHPAQIRISSHFKTFAEVKAIAEIDLGQMAYFSTATCWWGLDISNGFKTPSGHSLPCDPAGHVLYEAPAMRWLADCEKQQAKYGPHGLLAFACAFDGNLLDPNGRTPAFTQGWDIYTAIIDHHWDTFQRILRSQP